MKKTEMIVIKDNYRDLEEKINKYFTMYSKSTQQSYLTDLHIYFNLVGVSITDTKISNVVFYINELEKRNYAHSTFNRKLYSLSKVIDIYIANGLMEVNPVKQLRLIKKLDKNINKSIEINITLEDVKKVVSISKPRPSLIITTLATSGLRISELLDIKHTDISFYNDEMFEVSITGKGDKKRTIYLKQDLIKQIKNIFDADSEYLFNSNSGNRLLRQNTYNQIKKQFSLIGKDVSPHQLRHLYIDTQINIEGKAIKATSLYVGHKNVQVTLDFYTNKKLGYKDSNLL